MIRADLTVLFALVQIPLSEQILVGFKTLITDSACVRACAKKAGAVDRFGQPEILDDLLDGWAAKIHKQERLEFIHLLQEVALAKKVRVSILSGDAHVGGVGRLYSRHFPRLDPRQDPLFMVQIISSAVMNSPPPRGVVDMLMRTNFACEFFVSCISSITDCSLQVESAVSSTKRSQ